MTMGRGRLKMELIANEKSRKTTFQKRRRGIMKKAYEFSTLCEVDVCMIIYGPKLTDRTPELQTWPENPADVSRIIDRYKANTMGRPAKKTFDLSDLLIARKNKVYADLYRKRKEMYEAMYPTWDDRINNFSENQLEALLHAVDNKLESGKITLFNRKNGVDCPNHLVMEKPVPSKVFVGENYPSNTGDPSSQKPACNFYMPEQKPLTTLSTSTLDMLQPFNHHQLHHQPSDHHPMVQFDNNSDPYLHSTHLAPNPGPTAMWMMMESNYNYSLQLSGGASSSSSNSQSPPLNGYHQSNFNDPMAQYSTMTTTMQENVNVNMNTNMMMMMNNSVNNIPSPESCSPSLGGYYSRLMQPAVPYMPMQYPIMMSTPSISSSHHRQAQVHGSHQAGRDDQLGNQQYRIMNNRMA